MEDIPAAVMEIRVEFCDAASIIKHLRNLRNESQRAFAEFVGVSPTSIQQWETGNNQPVASMLFHVINKCGFTIHLDLPE